MVRLGWVVVAFDPIAGAACGVTSGYADFDGSLAADQFEDAMRASLDQKCFAVRTWRTYVENKNG